MKKLLISVILLAFFCSASFDSIVLKFEGDEPVAQVLFKLGQGKPEHYLQKIYKEDIKKGYELIHFGQTIHDGKKSKFISKYYKCISCHNTVREDKRLDSLDIEERLNYAIENNIPYLQGSTFWGIVNRTSWYNDDYFIKYGSLVEKARNSLKESTQLCAQICSQGRPLEDWEMNAIVSYYWSLQMNLDDLNIEMGALNLLGSNEEKINFINQAFLSKSPANFIEPPIDKTKGYGLKGDSKKGQEIYRLSCQHCHREGGESDVVLDNSKLTFNWLAKNINKNSQLSIYEIIRKGTYSQKGHKEYMPHYTAEKMSNQQIEDLRTFIEESTK